MAVPVQKLADWRPKRTDGPNEVPKKAFCWVIPSTDLTRFTNVMEAALFKVH